MGSGGDHRASAAVQFCYQTVSLRAFWMQSEPVLKSSLNRQNIFPALYVKPHGSLVPVSFNARCATHPAYQRRRLQRVPSGDSKSQENSSRGKFRA